jgi:hypothetical protein
MDQLSTLISRLEGISGVYEVFRDVPQERGAGSRVQGSGK